MTKTTINITLKDNGGKITARTLRKKDDVERSLLMLLELETFFRLLDEQTLHSFIIQAKEVVSIELIEESTND